MEEAKTKQNEVKIKKVMSAAVVLFSAVFFVLAVIVNIFEGTIWDILFYALGGILFTIIMVRLIGQIPMGRLGELFTEETFRTNAVQVICFALVCLVSIYYYDSGSEYGHRVAMKVIDAAFGIAMLAMFPKKERNDVGIGYLECLVFIIWFVISLRMNPTQHDIVLITFTGVMAMVYGNLLYVVIMRILQKKIRTAFSRYGILVFVFLIGIVLFRNTRTWTLSVAIPFACLYLYHYQKGGENRLLKNFCYGCILAFWMVAITSMLFRPYYGFEFTRYPSWFSSVASASLFWMLVFASALAAFLAKCDRCGISECLLELTTLGSVSTYLLMGMARTSILGVLVLSIVTIVLTQKYKYRDKWKTVIKKVMLLLGAMLVMLPVIYTLTRCMPALVHRPIWVTRAEWFSDRITKEDRISSSKYMNIPQFAESLLEKLVGIDINLTSMAGASTGPDDDSHVVEFKPDENGGVVAIYDYSFSNESDNSDNGRLDIWKLYFSHLNLFGHDSMIIENSDMELFHAHNTFIQVAFDHGVPVGIIFVTVTIGGIWMGIRYYKNAYKEESYAIYPVMIVIAFSIAGMTEWIFHPSIPIGFAYLFVLTPLLRRNL